LTVPIETTRSGSTDKAQEETRVKSSQSEADGEGKKRRSFKVLKAVVSVSVVLLFLQLLLGMWTNLFTTFPTPSQSVNPIDQIFTEGPPLLTLHVVIGLLLGILSIAGLVGAAYIKNRRLIALEACALVSVLVAGESGIEFVLGGYQENVFSYTMTVGYVMLLATYVWTSRRMGE